MFHVLFLCLCPVLVFCVSVCGSGLCSVLGVVLGFLMVVCVGSFRYCPVAMFCVSVLC